MLTDPTLNPEVITEAYDGLTVAKVAYAESLEKSLTLETALEKEKAAALSDGTIQGKNDTERKAAVNLRFAEAITALEDAARATRAARLEVELAEIEVKLVETLVRFLK